MIRFFGLLMTMLIGLRLAHIIDWSWYWVLGPVTVPATLFLFVVVAGGVWDAYKAKKRG